MSSKQTCLSARRAVRAPLWHAPEKNARFQRAELRAGSHRGLILAAEGDLLLRDGLVRGGAAQLLVRGAAAHLQDQSQRDLASLQLSGASKKTPPLSRHACFFEATKHQNAHQHRPPTLQQHQHSCTKPAGGALSSTFLARARVRGLASRGGGGARFLSLTPPSRPAVPGASDETDPRRWRSRRWQGVVGEFLPEVREFITRHTAFFCFRVYSRINQHHPIPTD